MAEPLDHIVFAVRQSPDWAGLARDHLAGRPIDPARYRPPRALPDFPQNIEALIARWNGLAGVDFFTCRARLKAIAAASLGGVARGVVVGCHELPRLMAAIAGRRFLVFFCDDDDWFEPDLFATLNRLDLEDMDVAVFPFVRLGRQSVTFIDPAHPPGAKFGQFAAFSQRYHTNNYALHKRLCTPEHLAAMQDHFDASAHGAAMNLVDRPFPLIVGATNKTPCAASFLTATVADAVRFRTMVADHVQELRSHPIAPELAWLRAPLAATAVLFEDVLGEQP